MEEVEPTGDAILRQLSAVVAGLERASERAWLKPTRCRPWDVRQLAAHIALPGAALANGLAALRSGAAQSRGGEPLSDDLSNNDVLDALRKRTATLQEQLSMLTGDELDLSLPRPIDGELSLPTRTLLRLALVEIGVHRNDLDAALGDADDLDDDVVDAVQAVVPTWLIFGAAEAPRPATSVSYELTSDRLRVGFVYERDSGWGLTIGEASCRIAGSDSGIALFMLGRTSVSASALSVSGDSDAADRFKIYLPGP